MKKVMAMRSQAFADTGDPCLDRNPVSTFKGKGAEAAGEVDRNERSLVFAAQSGNPEAIRVLYDKYRDRVWRILLYSLGDPQQVQDVFQSVFFKFFRGLSGFRFQSSLITWLYRIVRNECLNHRRRPCLPAIPLENIIGSRDEIDTRPGAETPEARWEREHVLMQAVRRLPPKMRDVVILKYIEDLSYEEIGRALGCAAGTVASRLNRALTALGERLGPFRRWL